MMKRIILAIFTLFLLNPVLVSAKEVTLVGATPKSKLVELHNGNTFQIVDLEENTVLDGLFTAVTLSKRIGVLCKPDKTCVIVLPTSDEIKVNKARTIFAAITVAVTIKLVFFNGGGGTVTGVTGGGACTPPACGAPGGVG